MLISLLRNSSGNIAYALIRIVMMIPVILLSLSAHECAHGYIAYKCGDGTARSFGRITLNPLKHLDPVGALMMLFVGFGWAKPVPVNMRNLRKPKRDMALVSLAGPAANLIIAFIAFFIQSAILAFYPQSASETVISVLGVIISLLTLFWVLNIGLAVFNLIPVPPLDGSKILASLLPNNLSYKYLMLEQYLRYFFIFLILSSWIPFNVGPFSNLSDLLFYPIEALRGLIAYGMYWITSKPFSLITGSDVFSLQLFKYIFGL